MKFFIELANIKIEINGLYDYTKELCHDYLIDNTDCDIRISIGAEEIDIERGRSLKQIPENNIPVPAGYLESLAIYRKIAEEILQYSIFLMHGSVIAIDQERCYMFTAVSGMGKTTHTRLWMNHLPEAFVINGDKPLLKVDQSGVSACGTPWCGKERWNKNCILPLKGICILERAEKNSIEEISFKEAFPVLFQQSYRPNDMDKMQQTLSLLGGLCEHVKFYRMKMNNFKDDAFEIAYKTIVGEL